MSRTHKGSKGPGWEPWSNLREKQEQQADYKEDEMKLVLITMPNGEKRQAMLDVTVKTKCLIVYCGDYEPKMEWVPCEWVTDLDKGVV